MYNKEYLNFSNYIWHSEMEALYTTPSNLVITTLKSESSQLNNKNCVLKALFKIH